MAYFHHTLKFLQIPKESMFKRIIAVLVCFTFMSSYIQAPLYASAYAFKGTGICPGF